MPSQAVWADKDGLVLTRGDSRAPGQCVWPGWAECCSKSVQNLAKSCHRPRIPESFFLSPVLRD